jgi:hypothetical protein
MLILAGILERAWWCHREWFVVHAVGTVSRM